MCLQQGERTHSVVLSLQHFPQDSVAGPVFHINRIILSVADEEIDSFLRLADAQERVEHPLFVHQGQGQTVACRFYHRCPVLRDPIALRQSWRAVKVKQPVAEERAFLSQEAQKLFMLLAIATTVENRGLHLLRESLQNLDGEG